MTVQIVCYFFLWCFIINLGLLLWWFLMFVFAHDLVYRWHSRWFALSRERFDAIHYQGMTFFKIAIFALNLVPYLALLIVGSAIAG
jgi:hypothetical protein